MTQLDLHRLGYDADAVALLMKGDLPDRDDRRFSILKALAWRLERLIEDHEAAQAVLKCYADEARPFALYLRSFKGEQENRHFAGKRTTSADDNSADILEFWTEALATRQIPALRCRGGADGIAVIGGVAPILTVKTDGWIPIVSELVTAAEAILIVISRATPGVIQEIELVRREGRTQRCLIIVLERPGSQTYTPDLAVRLKGFPNVVRVASGSGAKGLAVPIDAFLSRCVTPLSSAPRREPPGRLARFFRPQGERPIIASVERARTLPFSAVDNDLSNSADFRQLVQFVWIELLALRLLHEAPYWEGLGYYHLRAGGIDFTAEWRIAHQVYASAVIIEDFPAIIESLRYLAALEAFVGRANDRAIGQLSWSFGQLSGRLGRPAKSEHEQRLFSGWMPQNLPPGPDSALETHRAAMAMLEVGNVRASLLLFQAATNRVLQCLGGDDQEARQVSALILRDWAAAQETIDQGAWAALNRDYADCILTEGASANGGRAK